MVVKALARGLVEARVEGRTLELVLRALVLGQDLRLGRREDAVKAAQDGYRQHHALVLRRAIRAAQQVGDLPDQVGEVIVVRHVKLQAALRLGEPCQCLLGLANCGGLSSSCGFRLRLISIWPSCSSSTP